MNPACESSIIFGARVNNKEFSAKNEEKRTFWHSFLEYGACFLKNSETSKKENSHL